MPRENSLDWVKFVGKADPRATIVIICHCGEWCKPLTDTETGTDFICAEHGVVAFAAAGKELSSMALQYVRLGRKP